MKLTFIEHSCFLLETEKTIFLFDYFQGKLPSLPNNKPLFIFASHFHGDHFSQKIFDIMHSNIIYILDGGIKRKIKKDVHQEKIFFVDESKSYSIEGIEVTTLKSTDEGVAFVIGADDINIYHAGDLNHWHWDGENNNYNSKMKQDYLFQIDKISGTKFDLACIPIDPRLETAFYMGLEGFLERCTAKTIAPMHMWDNFNIVRAIKEKYPNENILQIKNNNQEFEV